MGEALARAALDLGHEVVILSGPVHVAYPARAELIQVVSTEELLEAGQRLFPHCDGLIAAAAPCDYRPRRVRSQKIVKNGQPLRLELIETPDVAATLGAAKQPHQWTVGFALETEDQHFRALAKLERKCCDLIVLNGPQAMDAIDNSVEVLDDTGDVLAAFSGSKEVVARGILRLVQARLIRE
jgi:phosphopantothenoylcysteine decarboxylase/phosphopantothenate--cysteine ligase